MPKKKVQQKRKCEKPASGQGYLKINKCRSKIRNHTADPTTLFNYANLLNKRGESTTAAKVYRKGLKRSPNNISALINIACILITQFKFTEAIIYLTRVIINVPDHCFAYIYRSLAYVGANKKAEAYRDFKFVYEKYPDMIHHFNKMDKDKFPRIDFDQALQYSLYPEGVAHLRPDVYFPTVDCPVDEICLFKDFCLQKEVCPQNEAAFMKDIILRKKLGHPGLSGGKTVGNDVCHPGYSGGKTVIIDMDEMMDRSAEMLVVNESESVDPVQPEIVSEMDFMEVFGSEIASGNFGIVQSKPIKRPERFWGIRLSKSPLSIFGIKLSKPSSIIYVKLFKNIQDFKNRMISIFTYVFLILILPFFEVLLETEFYIDI